MKNRIATLLCTLIASACWSQIVDGSLNPDNAYFHARDLAFAGDHRGAREILQVILAEHPSYSDVRSLLAQTYSWEADYDKARRHLNRITSTDRKNKDAWAAAIRNEIYADNFNIALGLANKALLYLPGDEELMALREQCMSGIQRSNRQAAEKSETLEGVKVVNKLAVYNAFDVFDVVYEPMIYSGVEYSRTTGLGNIIPRLNYAHRFETHGLQYESDFFPVMSKTFYGYLNYGYSASEIFPRHKAGAELYANLSGAKEVSLGMRYYDFISGGTAVYTGSFGLYTGDYYISARPYITPGSGGNIGASGALTARKYTRDKDHYLGAVLAIGFIPELRQFRSGDVLLAETLFFIESQQILAEYQFGPKGSKSLYRAQLGLTHQELVFEPGRFFWAISAGFRYQVGF